jgi:glyoxylase-like metal-dependent hydrolase (beta-lactamase superfamily II)
MSLLLHAVQASLGDTFILQFTDGSGKRFWMVDGGPGNWAMAETYKKAANCLFGTLNSESLNIRTLERLVVTHNDFDHTYGAYALLVGHPPPLFSPGKTRPCRCEQGSLTRYQY